MKRLFAVIAGLLVLPAFAEVAPAYYYEELMAQYADQMPDTEFVDETVVDEPAAETPESKPVTPVTPTTPSPRNSSGRATASRSMVNSNTVSSRGVASRNVVNANTARTVSTRAATTSGRSGTVSRAAAQTTSRAGTTRGSATNTVASRAVSNVRSAPTSSTRQTSGVTTRTSTRTTTNPARASIVQTDTVNTPLYISGRVGVSTNNVTTRVPTVRVGSSSTATSSVSSSGTTVSSTTSIDELAQLTDYCKAQYVACMDNFCNVLDDNQGRCSCSANLDNYAETEAALKDATESLQEVAMQIQYIGLTTEEVETLFTQTAAELELSSSSDNSALKNDLDKIKSLIVDVKSGKASSSSSGLNFDMSGLLDFTIDSTGFDLSSLLGGFSNSNDSISNQRGKQLYETASARCKAAVLNNCAAQGVDTAIITNAYDLEIDKACIAYERSLTESNDQMSSTVRNAKSVLQRARLMVAQQKNQYDLRGCINALDDCMQDDFVCGDNYENCLDPTGKYIVNGEIVVGSKPGVPGDIEKAAIYDMWDYDTSKNAWDPASTDGTSGTLSGYINSELWPNAPTDADGENSTSIAEFLQSKIGYHNDADGKNYGMCMSVLNRCQDVTYSGTGQNLKYTFNNPVVKEYLNRTLVQIKSAQDTILSDYAEECITDISTCLAQNNYDPDNEGSTANKIAIRACQSMIDTCQSVNGIKDGDGLDSDTLDVNEWVCEIMGGSNCKGSGN